jgi:hypothetical protein
MRYRKLEPKTGDYSFGRGQGDFFVNVPEAVGQYVYTRLMLWQGQWFYDTSQGTPWQTEVLGERTQATRDVVVRQTVGLTPGVSQIRDYASVFDPNQRSFAAAVVIDTVYGPPVRIIAPLLPATVPPIPPPSGSAQMLGLVGGQRPKTGTVMRPADLTQPGQAQISGFQITRVDSGRF